MENIWSIIYNLSVNDRILNIYDIDKILEILIDEKDLSKYISNIEVQQIRSNKLASYSNYYKKIIVYSNVVDRMVNNIEENIKVNNKFTKTAYINLSVLQIILHEVEHANQEKIINHNTLESFILRIAQIVEQEKQIYEVNPAERFAEIKSYDDIYEIISIDENNKRLKSLIKNDQLQRKIRGYHYCNNKLNSPIELYFVKGKKEHLLSAFDWYSNNSNTYALKVSHLYNEDDTLFYGFPIFEKNYIDIMQKLIVKTNENYNNKIKIIKK